MPMRHSLIANEAKRIAKGQAPNIRYVSSRIGKQMLYNILNDIDMLDNTSRELKEYSESSILSKYANPTYMYNEYKDVAFIPSRISERNRIIRSSFYENMQVFDALKYVANKVKGNPIANSLLISIFNPIVVANVAYVANTQLYVYDAIMNKHKDELMKVVQQVYEEREKWVTGLSAKNMRIEMKKIDSRGVQAVYFQLVSTYRPRGRNYGYYNRLMDTGIYNKADLPTTKQIYGWIKRRQAAGKWRPLIAVGWRNRIDKYGTLTGDSYLAKKAPNPQDKELDPGTSAYLIALRMRRRFEKRGRLSPFGSFAKYMKRNSIFPTSIFTEIFRKYVGGFESTVVKNKGKIVKETELEFKLKLQTVIKHIKRGNSAAVKEIKSLNHLIKQFNIRIIKDYPISSSYRVEDIRKLIKLAKNLGVSIRG